MDYEIITCSKCGKQDKACYMGDVRSKMVERNMCFTCNFWQDKVEIKDKENIIRINGEHRSYFPDVEGNQWHAGHGGSEFKFVKDGQVIVSRNVWYQGEIPEHFKDELPDNAEWYKS